MSLHLSDYCGPASLEELTFFWKKYFDKVPPPTNVNTTYITMCQLLLEYYGDRGQALVANVDWTMEQSSEVYFNYHDLSSSEPLPDFDKGLREHFNDVTAAMGLSLAIVRSRIFPAPNNPVCYPAAIIVDVRPHTAWSELTSSAVGKFVSLPGTIVKVTPPRPVIHQAAFQCQRCGNIVNILMEEGKWIQPTLCSGKAGAGGAATCKSNQHSPLSNMLYCEDWQLLRLQESQTSRNEDTAVRSGQQGSRQGASAHSHEAQGAGGGAGGGVSIAPRTVGLEVRGTLLNSVTPGETVSVCGVLQAIEREVQMGRGASNRSQFTLYIRVHSMTQLANGRAAKLHISPALGLSASTRADLSGFSAADMARFERLARHADPLALLIASFCPRIIGHETVKLGLLMGLFGGSRRPVEEISTPTKHVIDMERALVAAGGFPGINPSQGPIAVGAVQDREQNIRLANKAPRSAHIYSRRGDIHIAVVGDPGMGKSQLLLAASRLAPRSVFVSGQTTTARGLTVTIVPGGGSGEQDSGVEPGAMVLADTGVCCIDEFDKMGPENASSLLEAMEQQSISVAKGSVVYSLRARTGVLAAANPSGGHYDRSKSVPENLRLPPALLSRFDLVHLLIDTPDKAAEADIAASVLSRVHAKPSGAVAQGRQQHPSQATSQAYSTQDWMAGSQSVERLMGVGSMGAGAGRGHLSYAEELKQRVRAINPVDYVPEHILKKYIAYSRKFTQPGLAAAAYARLQLFFVSLRKANSDSDTVPVTTRQLESLVRLTQARAKMVCSRIADDRHAEDAVRLFQTSLYDVVTDEDGNINFSNNPGAAVTLPEGAAMIEIQRRLKKRERERNSPFISEQDLYAIIASVPTKSKKSAEQMIHALSDKCIILVTGHGGWKIQP